MDMIQCEFKVRNLNKMKTCHFTAIRNLSEF